MATPTPENANCTNVSCSSAPLTPYIHPRNWPMITILSVVVIFGILANASLIFMVLKNKPLRKTQNILFVNLMVGDLLCLLIKGILSLELSISQLQTKLTGNFLCKVTNSSLIMSTSLVVYSLVALSIERYYLIKDPLYRWEDICCSGSGHWCARNPHVAIVATIWIFSFTVSAPLLVWAEESVNGCLYTAHHTTKAKIYEIFLVMVTYIIPFIIIATVHIIMACNLLKSIRDPIVRNSERLSCNGDGNRLRQRGSRTRSRMKLAVVVSVLSAFFFIAKLPSSIFFIMYEFYEYEEFSKEFYKFSDWNPIAFPLLCAFNPVMMFILSASLRGQLRRCCCAPVMRRSCSSQRTRQLQIEMH